MRTRAVLKGGGVDGDLLVLVALLCTFLVPNIQVVSLSLSLFLFLFSLFFVVVVVVPAVGFSSTSS